MMRSYRVKEFLLVKRPRGVQGHLNDTRDRLETL